MTPQHRPGPTGLSPSRAADFKSCPLKFRYRTVDRIPEPPNAAAARGTLVHSVLENLFRHPAAERIAAVATGSIPELWQDMISHRPELADLDEATDLDSWYRAAGALVERYFGLEDPSRFEPAECETRLEVTLPGDVPTRGVIDRVDINADGLVRIVDYKTGKAPPPAYTDEALFQLKFYALMLYRLRGVVASRLRLVYLGNGRLVEYTPDAAGLEQFETTVVALWRAIERATTTGDFPPRRSKLCDWCSFQSICPEFGGTPPAYPAHAVAGPRHADGDGGH